MNEGMDKWMNYRRPRARQREPTNRNTCRKEQRERSGGGVVVSGGSGSAIYYAEEGEGRFGSGGCVCVCLMAKPNASRGAGESRGHRGVLVVR